ncbi:MAG: hypothetical protein K9W44_17845 [Candidatus Lokiarchaeota archaeon]|nr:hypothetical protein [Candidatus Harpocratesius repetitus]
MPKKSSKSKKNVRVIACEQLVSLNAISNSGAPLCRCKTRKFTMSPYNIVCQVCELYRERKDELTHSEMYIADDAPDFHYDLDEIDISDDDFGDESLEFDEDLDLDVDDLELEEEIVKPVKRKKRSAQKAIEEDEEDEEFEDEEEFEDDEDVALVIGVTEEEPEDELDYEDEREEGLGKKHGKIFEEDEIEEEDEELDEELEELEDDIIGIDDEEEVIEDEIDDDTRSTTSASTIDFENDVIKKIKTVGTGDAVKQICPFCQKAKVSVLRHLPKCKRAPPEIIEAYKIYKQKKK